jgi:hypothetical protein
MIGRVMFKSSLIRVAILILSSFILIFSACDSLSKSSKNNSTKKVVLRLNPSPENPRNSEGDFITLKDGRILFIYTHFTEGSGDHAGAYLASRVSSDRGESWSQDDVTVVPNEGGMNVMSVSLLRLLDDRIALFYCLKNSEQDCRPLIRISSDEGDSWSDAQKCIDETGYYVLNNDRVIQLENGRLILPVALHNYPGSKWSNTAKIMCWYSDDIGDTWHKSTSAANPENIILQEPGLVALKNGTLLMFIRTDMDVQYLSYSKDQGKSWSDVEASNITSPLSPATIERIPATGDLLMIWNNNKQSGNIGGLRTPYNCAISKDDGKTWQKTKTIESDPRGWYCYTAIEFVDDHVLLGHCAGDTRIGNGLSTTNITKLHIDWIYTEPTPKPSVLSDSNGVVTIGCKSNKASIYYTLDGSMPDENSEQYTQPIQIAKKALLHMQAFEHNKPTSAIISQNVGSDFFIPALQIAQAPAPDLNFAFYEGEFLNTIDLKQFVATERGTSSTIGILNAEKKVNFGYKFSGFIKIAKEGVYTFYLTSNDGSRLLLNDQEIINNEGMHANRLIVESISLRAGYHRIELDYFQAGGGSILKLMWSGPGFEKSYIASSLLFHHEE